MQVGVLALELHPVVEAITGSGLDAAHRGTGDIEIGAVDAPGDRVCRYRAAVRVVQLAGAGVGDLVFVVGVEQRDITAEFSTGVVVKADFAVFAFFRFQIRVAPGVSTTALRQADIGVGLGDGRRLEALGHAAF